MTTEHTSPASDSAASDNASPVRLDVVDSVATITLARPAASNALDLETAHALHDAALRVGADDAVGALVLVGEGKRFCAGGDVTSMLHASDRTAHLHELATAADQALVALASIDKPVVAGVHGAVAGAGLAVMLSCDIVVADPQTRFLSAYAGVGLTPDCGLSWMLPRAVGQQRSLELLLTSRALDAHEAHAWGLVNEIADNVHERAHEIAAQLAAGPTWALGQARRLARASWNTSRADTGRDEATTIARAVTQPVATQLLDRFSR